MKRQRLAGIEKEMARVISKVLMEEVKNPKVKGLVSVTNINVTEDLKFADVYFSVMGQENVNTDEVIEGLNQIKGFLRKRVAEEIEIRYIPEIRVKLDTSIEHAIKISKLLNDLKR
ncbi:30S ribosome-binding factor RbfA [uncultured Fusobacterium sp.]|uniref:30S ribosome-binding factor RbfA n=1 Tax=uncultured Fusobacterium sp. TaxID=159267 RepID=UPI0026006B8B|nr:30S ribosome-binding factor RbfA [uncultured Fusobacterium sp.]